jgi:hypothetical protein
LTRYAKAIAPTGTDRNPGPPAAKCRPVLDGLALDSKVVDLWPQGGDERQVAVALHVVEPVPHHEHARDVEGLALQRLVDAELGWLDRLPGRASVEQ